VQSKLTWSSPKHASRGVDERMRATDDRGVDVHVRDQGHGPSLILVYEVSMSHMELVWRDC
jgi:hypothetical protein